MAKTTISRQKLVQLMVNALFVRYKSQDWVAATEVCVGRGTSHRMDFYATRKSWTAPASHCVEIKVDRSDFMNDDKYPAYFPACTHLYFACPHGMIHPNELPPGVGLIYLSKTGNKLYTKVKPAAHGKDDPEVLTACLRRLVWREEGKKPPSRSQRVREYLQTVERTKKLDNIISWEYQKRLETAEREAKRAANETEALKKRLANLEEVKQYLDDNQISIGFSPLEQVKRLLSDDKGVTATFARDIRTASNALKKLDEALHHG